MSWKRRIGWAVLGVAILVLVVLIGGYFYLKSSSFETYALRKIAEQAELQSDGWISVSELSLRISTTLLFAARKAPTSLRCCMQTNSQSGSRSSRRCVVRYRCANF